MFAFVLTGSGPGLVCEPDGPRGAARGARPQRRLLLVGGFAATWKLGCLMDGQHTTTILGEAFQQISRPFAPAPALDFPIGLCEPMYDTLSSVYTI